LLRDLTASRCRRQWSGCCCHSGKQEGEKQSIEFTEALSWGGVDGKRRRKVEMRIIVII